MGDGVWCADGTPHAWCRVGAIRPPESVKPRRRMRWHFRRGSEINITKGLDRVFLGGGLRKFGVRGKGG